MGKYQLSYGDAANTGRRKRPCGGGTRIEQVNRNIEGGRSTQTRKHCLARRGVAPAGRKTTPGGNQGTAEVMPEQKITQFFGGGVEGRE